MRLLDMEFEVNGQVHTVAEVLDMPAAEIQRVVDELDAEISRMESDKSTLDQKIAKLRNARQTVLELTQPESPAGIQLGRCQSLTKRDAMKEAIRETGRPITAPEIAEWITRHGWGNGRKTPKEIENSVRTTLSTHPRIFKKAEGMPRGYWTLVHQLKTEVNGIAE